MNARRTTGKALLAGAALFFAALAFLEAIEPGYDRFAQVISDLGLGPNAWAFNGLSMVAGAGLVAMAWLLFKARGDAVFSALLAAAGIGLVGIGTFTKNVWPIHQVAAFATFVAGPLAAVWSAKGGKGKWKLAFAGLGLLSLVALALFASGNYLGLGRGGMERLIVYPLIVWAALFGRHLAAGEK